VYYTPLKISYDKINNRNDPYQLFLDGIKSPETARKYTKSLEKFLRSIPDEVYEKSIRRKKSDKELARTFVDLATKNPNLATDIIATYIKEEKRLVESGQLSSGTLENHIKPIKVLLELHRIQFVSNVIESIDPTIFVLIVNPKAQTILYYFGIVPFIKTSSISTSSLKELSFDTNRILKLS